MLSTDLGGQDNGNHKDFAYPWGQILMLRSWMSRAKCRIAFLSWVETSREHNRKVKRSKDSQSWRALWGKSCRSPSDKRHLRVWGILGEKGKTETLLDSKPLPFTRSRSGTQPGWRISDTYFPSGPVSLANTSTRTRPAWSNGPFCHLSMLPCEGGSRVSSSTHWALKMWLVSLKHWAIRISLSRVCSPVHRLGVRPILIIPLTSVVGKLIR